MLFCLVVTMGKVMSLDELNAVQGRAWDDVDVSSFLPNKQATVELTRLASSIDHPSTPSFRDDLA